MTQRISLLRVRTIRKLHAEGKSVEWIRTNQNLRPMVVDQVINLKGRYAKVTPGQLAGERSRRTIDEDMVKTIRRMIREGMFQNDIARKLKVSQSSVWGIGNDRIYRDVPGEGLERPGLIVASKRIKPEPKPKVERLPKHAGILDDIRAMREAGQTIEVIADAHGISPSAVRRLTKAHGIKSPLAPRKVYVKNPVPRKPSPPKIIAIKEPLDEMAVVQDWEAGMKWADLQAKYKVGYARISQVIGGARRTAWTPFNGGREIKEHIRNEWIKPDAPRKKKRKPGPLTEGEKIRKIAAKWGWFRNTPI